MRIRLGIAALVLAALLSTGCSRGTESASNTTSGLTTESIAQTRTTEASSAEEASVTGDPNKPISEALKAAPGLSTMTKLLETAGMMTALSGKTAKTLFAPTDAAFRKVPPDTLAKLQEPANKEKLRQLLRYHLVLGKVPAEQMVTIKRVMTYQGGVHTVTSSKETSLTIDGSVRILQPDVAASNGYLDVVDTVMLPKGFAP